MGNCKKLRAVQFVPLCMCFYSLKKLGVITFSTLSSHPLQHLNDMPFLVKNTYCTMEPEIKESTGYTYATKWSEIINRAAVQPSRNGKLL